MNKYPPGGPREPVYALMRKLGLSMSDHSDKQWRSADGIEVVIYGAGSIASISVNGASKGECALDGLSRRLDRIRMEG